VWISVCELRGMRNTSTDFQQSDFISDAKPLMFQVAENIVLILVEVSLPHPLGHIQRCIYTVLSVVSGARILPVGEGNGTPLQCSCLEKPRDGGAWWAAVYGVAESRTRLERLSSSSSSSSSSILPVKIRLLDFRPALCLAWAEHRPSFSASVLRLWASLRVSRRDPHPHT